MTPSAASTRKGSTSSGSEEEWEPEGVVHGFIRSGPEEEMPVDPEPPQPTHQQYRLNKKGYIRLHRLVPDDLCKRLRDAAVAIPNHKRNNLFGKDDKDGMDPKRLTTKAPRKLMEELFCVIEIGCRTFFPDAEPRDWVYLKSLDGGKEQPAHRDFSPIPTNQELYDYTRLPASVIIGIDEGSYIDGYGWSRFVADELERETIHIGKGYILIFRGDFIHAGGGYQTTNYKIHCFLDPRNSERRVREENKIDLIQTIPLRRQVDEYAPQQCFAYRCGLMFPSAPAMRKHMRKDHGLFFKDYPKTIKQEKRPWMRCRPVSRQSTRGTLPRERLAARASTLQPPDGYRGDSIAPTRVKKLRCK